MLTRAELLGQIMRNYDTPIAVSGTHGKTTTTSMLSHILMAADCDPTISVGGILPSIGGNIRVGHSETFLTEACEYTNSFLSFFPKIGIILNMDADHLDFFKDIDDIRHSFRAFARLLPTDGMLIINADTPKYDYVTEGLGCKVVTYALENQAVADYTAANITYDEFDHPSFDCICRGELRGRYTLMVPGLHNVSTPWLPLHWPMNCSCRKTPSTKALPPSAEPTAVSSIRYIPRSKGDRRLCASSNRNPCNDGSR